MTVLIDHPETFRIGTRVLMMKGRHKDGLTHERMLTRVTHSVEHFNKALAELLRLIEPNERIYASAGERAMKAAMREFKRRQLDADYDQDPELFYRAIESRWVASLMQPTCQQSKIWLFDCDSDDDKAHVQAELAAHYDRPTEPYVYPSKSGWHIVVSAFNRTLISDRARGLLHDNAIMLWAY